MVRRHSALTWRSPARALTLATSILVPTLARAQLPEIPTYTPPAGGAVAAPAPVGSLPEPDPVPSDPRPAPQPAPGAGANRPLSPIGARPAAAQDPAVRPTGMPDPEPDDKGALLGPAKDRPGAPAGPKADEPADGYDLKMERIPPGRQAVGLTVEVIAPEVMNIGQTKTVRIVVRNTGVADASAVRVHYNLPKELALVSAQPESKALPDEPGKLFWTLNLLAAGSEQTIAVKVKPKTVGAIDHASAVSLMVGARAHTSIQEPMLRVEQTVSPAKVLQGEQVRFRITVSNPGSGPARDVTVRAKLSSGLRTSSGDEIVEQTIPVLQAGQHVELDPLEADTIAGGEQTCTVTAESDDVAKAPAEVKVARSVTVLRPELTLALQGPEMRYTDTPAEYRVVVSNPGTAAAKNIRVALTLPASGGKLLKPWPAGAEWNAATQKLSWVIPNLEPTRGPEPSKVTSTIRVRLGGVGSYRIVADAKAGGLFAKDGITTSVSGMADIDLDVDEKKRVLDVNESTIFDITVKNLGTKDAKNLLVTAVLSPNVQVAATAGTDSEANYDGKSYDAGQPYTVVFPKIDSLAPRGELKLSISVDAKKAGSASCRVKILHDDLKEAEALEAVANVRITPNVR